MDEPVSEDDRTANAREPLRMYMIGFMNLFFTYCVE